MLEAAYARHDVTDNAVIMVEHLIERVDAYMLAPYYLHPSCDGGSGVCSRVSPRDEDAHYDARHEHCYLFCCHVSNDYLLMLPAPRREQWCTVYLVPE